MAHILHDENTNESDDFVSPTPSTTTPISAPSQAWVQIDEQCFQSFEAFTEWKRRDLYRWKAKYKGNLKISGTKQRTYHVFKCDSCVDACTVQVNIYIFISLEISNNVQLKAQYNQDNKNWSILKKGDHANNSVTVRKAPKRGWDSIINAEIERSFEDNITRKPYDILQKLRYDFKDNSGALGLIPSLKSIQNKKYRMETQKESVHGIRYLSDLKDWIKTYQCESRETYALKGILLIDIFIFDFHFSPSRR